MAILRVSVMRLVVAAMAVAAGVLFFSGAGEARVLLTLDDFGAVGDGITNDTQAFLDAWNAACASTEPAVLAVPAGKTYQIWPVRLAGPCKKKLKLMISGTIAAPASPDEWAGRDPTKWLYVFRVDDLSVSGGGTIDGMGAEWWARSCKRKKTKPCSTVSAPKVSESERSSIPAAGVRSPAATVTDSSLCDCIALNCRRCSSRSAGG
jgi:galacturan 1,4-alpha-galacturonidase